MYSDGHEDFADRMGSRHENLQQELDQRMEAGAIPKEFKESYKPQKQHEQPTDIDKQMTDMRQALGDQSKPIQIPDDEQNSRILAANLTTHPSLSQLVLYTDKPEDHEQTAAQRMLFARS